MEKRYLQPAYAYHPGEIAFTPPARPPAAGRRAGTIIYMIVFAAMIIVAAVHLGVQRKPIFILPLLAAACYLVDSFVVINFGPIADVVVLIFLTTLNMLWHELVTIPRRTWQIRKGMLITGIILLLLNIILIVLTFVGVIINIICAAFGTFFIVLGYTRAKPRDVVEKRSMTGQWEHLHRHGRLLIALWSLCLCRTVYALAEQYVENAENEYARFLVGFLFASIILILAHLPHFVAEIDPNDYIINGAMKGDMEEQRQSPAGAVSDGMEGRDAESTMDQDVESIQLHAKEVEAFP